MKSRFSLLCALLALFLPSVALSQSRDYAAPLFVGGASTLNLIRTLSSKQKRALAFALLFGRHKDKNLVQRLGKLDPETLALLGNLLGSGAGIWWSTQKALTIAPKNKMPEVQADPLPLITPPQPPFPGDLPDQPAATGAIPLSVNTAEDVRVQEELTPLNQTPEPIHSTPTPPQVSAPAQVSTPAQPAKPPIARHSPPALAPTQKITPLVPIAPATRPRTSQPVPTKPINTTTQPLPTTFSQPHARRQEKRAAPPEAATPPLPAPVNVHRVSPTAADGYEKDDSFPSDFESPEASRSPSPVHMPRLLQAENNLPSDFTAPSDRAQTQVQSSQTNPSPTNVVSAASLPALTEENDGDESDRSLTPSLISTPATPLFPTGHAPVHTAGDVDREQSEKTEVNGEGNQAEPAAQAPVATEQTFTKPAKATPAVILAAGVIPTTQNRGATNPPPPTAQHTIAEPINHTSFSLPAPASAASSPEAPQKSLTREPTQQRQPQEPPAISAAIVAQGVLQPTTGTVRTNARAEITPPHRPQIPAGQTVASSVSTIVLPAVEQTAAPSVPAPAPDSGAPDGCPICLRSLCDVTGVPSELIKTINCGNSHRFHASCITRWSNSGSANAHLCPNCRGRFSLEAAPTGPETPTCPICLEEMKRSEAAIALPCSALHRFHTGCLQPLRSCICPCCRTPFDRNILTSPAPRTAVAAVVPYGGAVSRRMAPLHPSVAAPAPTPVRVINPINPLNYRPTVQVRAADAFIQELKRKRLTEQRRRGTSSEQQPASPALRSPTFRDTPSTFNLSLLQILRNKIQSEVERRSSLGRLTPADLFAENEQNAYLACRFWRAYIPEPNAMIYHTKKGSDSYYIICNPTDPAIVLVYPSHNSVPVFTTPIPSVAAMADSPENIRPFMLDLFENMDVAATIPLGEVIEWQETGEGRRHTDAFREVNRLTLRTAIIELQRQLELVHYNLSKKINPITNEKLKASIERDLSVFCDAIGAAELASLKAERREYLATKKSTQNNLIEEWERTNLERSNVSCDMSDSNGNIPDPKERERHARYWEWYGEQLKRLDQLSLNLTDQEPRLIEACCVHMADGCQGSWGKWRKPDPEWGGWYEVPVSTPPAANSAVVYAEETAVGPVVVSRVSPAPASNSSNPREPATGGAGGPARTPSRLPENSQSATSSHPATEVANGFALGEAEQNKLTNSMYPGRPVEEVTRAMTNEKTKAAYTEDEIRGLSQQEVAAILLDKPMTCLGRIFSRLFSHTLDLSNIPAIEDRSSIPDSLLTQLPGLRADSELSGGELYRVERCNTHSDLKATCFAFFNRYIKKSLYIFDKDGKLIPNDPSYLKLKACMLVGPKLTGLVSRDTLDSWFGGVPRIRPVATRTAQHTPAPVIASTMQAPPPSILPHPAAIPAPAILPRPATGGAGGSSSSPSAEDNEHAAEAIAQCLITHNSQRIPGKVYRGSSSYYGHQLRFGVINNNLYVETIAGKKQAKIERYWPAQLEGSELTEKVDSKDFVTAEVVDTFYKSSRWAGIRLPIDLEMQHQRFLTINGHDIQDFPCVGEAALQGRRDFMEDASTVKRFNIECDGATRSISCYAVMDGHGDQSVAIKCAQRLPALLASCLARVKHSSSPEVSTADTITALKQTCLRFDAEQCPSDNAGSAAVIFLIDETDKSAVVLGVGDCRLMAGNASGECVFQTRDLHGGTKDESQGLDEFARITRAGGIVVQGRRVTDTANHWSSGSLDMSRAFGDAALKRPIQGKVGTVVTAEPIIYFLSQKDLEKCNFVVMACDGVVNDSGAFWVEKEEHLDADGKLDYTAFEEASSAKVCQFVALEKRRGSSAAQAAQRLVEHTYRKGSTDNQSALVIYLDSVESFVSSLKGAQTETITITTPPSVTAAPSQGQVMTEEMWQRCYRHPAPTEWGHFHMTTDLSDGEKFLFSPGDTLTYYAKGDEGYMVLHHDGTHHAARNSLATDGSLKVRKNRPFDPTGYSVVAQISF